MFRVGAKIRVDRETGNTCLFFFFFGLSAHPFTSRRERLAIEIIS